MKSDMPRLQLRGVSKRYDNGLLANDAVDLEVARGEIHALIGENGAGKSTLMKILYGLEQPSAGQVLLDGQPVRFRSPRAAIAAGVGLVPQHVQLVPSFTVAQNVVLGAEPLRAGLLDHQAALAAVRGLSGRYGLQADPLAVTGTLSLGEQQRVEILKALYRGATLLLLDEPAAVLSPDEAAALYRALRGLTGAGLTVLLITHKLAEVLEVADRYTVLRAGRVTGRGRSAQASAGELTRLIVGGAPPPAPAAALPRRPAPPAGGTVRLAARNLRMCDADGVARLDGVSLEVAAGEILGIAGVEGNGQSALAAVLGGAALPDGGSIMLDGDAYGGRGVRHAIEQGVAMVPEDRLRDGAAPGLSIAENAMASCYHRPPLSRLGWLQPQAVRAMAQRMIDGFGVKAQGPEQPIGALSGGNMQKIVLARALQSGPKVLIACQPTRGVDIGAARFLRSRLEALRRDGAAIVLVSADLDEVLELSDRIAVMFRGRIAGHFRAAQASAPLLGAYMTGARRQPGASACLDAPFAAGGEGAA